MTKTQTDKAIVALIEEHVAGGASQADVAESLFLWALAGKMQAEGVGPLVDRLASAIRDTQAVADRLAKA